MVSTLKPPRLMWSPTGMLAVANKAVCRLDIGRPGGALVTEQGDQGVEHQHELEEGQAPDGAPPHGPDEQDEQEGHCAAQSEAGEGGAGERLAVGFTLVWS